MKNLVKTIYQATLQNGGASYNLYGVAPKDGFMVADFGAEEVILKEDFTEEVLWNFISKNLNRLKNKDVCVGTWENEGKIYLDLSQNIKNKNQAIKQGIINKQLAIFDLSNFNSIAL